jgi:NADPH-dependent glutamate synthase beta subunit-like oxidoreductase
MSGAVPAPKVVPPKLNPVRVPIPETPPAQRVQDFGEILHPYPLKDAVLEAKRCIQCRRPWCVEACPISQDCREYIRLVAEEKYDESAVVTLRENPLATTLCKVCYHYCEDACVVKKKGVPIAIRHLKRVSLEEGRSDLVYVPRAPRNQRVAIVGAGPAGLMAAWELGVRGYSVSVFEQEELLGGLIRTIPNYRIRGEDLQEDLDRFRGLDVTFVPEHRIGSETRPKDLLAQGYRAVLLTIGTSTHRSLRVPGEELPGVLPALGLLRRVHRGLPVQVGRRIVVIGGGDVAMDAIRSCVRLSPGGEVTLVYRRTREEMPADPEELHGAEEEGIHFRFQLSPVRIAGSERAEGLVVVRMEPGPPAASGRASLRPVPGSEETIPCDTVVVAVGQKADLTGLEEGLDLKESAGGWVEGKGEGYATAVPGIFAAGGKSVVYAMAAGTKAAEAIDRYLRGLEGQVPGPRPDPFGKDSPFALPAGYTKPLWNAEPRS